MAHGVKNFVLITFLILVIPFIGVQLEESKQSQLTIVIHIEANILGEGAKKVWLEISKGEGARFSSHNFDTPQKYV